MALGTMAAGGVPKAFFQEFLDSTLTIFEEGLSRGVIKGFEEVNEMQARIARMGPQFQGQYGLRAYRGMETAVAGATALQSEKDVIIFRAARRKLEAEGAPTDYISVQKEVEKGVNQQLMEYIIADVNRMSGGITPDAIELLRTVISGMTYTSAEATLAEFGGGKRVEGALAYPGWNVRGTPEMQLLGIQTQMMNIIRKLGKGVLGPKAQFLQKTLLPVLTSGENWFGNIQDKRSYLLDVYNNPETYAEETGMSDVVSELMGYGAYPHYAIDYTTNIRKPLMTPRKYSSQVVGAADTLRKLFSSIPSASIEGFGQTGALYEIMDKAMETLSEGESRKGAFSAEDLPMVLSELVTAIQEFNKSVAAEKQIDITNIMEQ